MEEARSILHDAVEFLAHAHAMIGDLELQKTWLSKNDGKPSLEEFKRAFEEHTKEGIFKGLDELHKTWRELSETGSHANINALVDRFVQVTSGDHIKFRLNYTGLEARMRALLSFTMLLTCATMEQSFFNDYEGRLKLNSDLMRMRGEFDRYKERLRQTLITRCAVRAPGGIHPAPRPTIYRP
jgi:hypothetical protein